MFLLKKYSLIFYFKHSNTLTIISFFECKNKEKYIFPLTLTKLVEIEMCAIHWPAT